MSVSQASGMPASQPGLGSGTPPRAMVVRAQMRRDSRTYRVLLKPSALPITFGRSQISGAPRREPVAGASVWSLKASRDSHARGSLPSAIRQVVRPPVVQEVEALRHGMRRSDAPAAKGLWAQLAMKA